MYALFLATRDESTNNENKYGVVCGRTTTVIHTIGCQLGPRKATEVSVPNWGHRLQLW